MLRFIESSTLKNYWELNLNTINPRTTDYLTNKLIFNLPSKANNLKITFIANAPTVFGASSVIWTCTENGYLTIAQTYYANIPYQPSLIWMHRDLFYEIIKWQ